MGLLVDERADTLDVTATIIDLAVRGYLSIEEVPKTGWFGRRDWRLTRLKSPDAQAPRRTNASCSTGSSSQATRRGCPA